MSDSEAEILVEVFPIRASSLPRLFGYTVDAGGGDATSLGGRFSYRLKQRFAGHWVWTNGKIVTDKPQAETDIMKLVEELWKEQPDTYKDLRNVRRLADLQPAPQEQADFVANGMLRDYEREIASILKTEARDLGNARMERYYETRGWVVNGKPALSISVFSRLIHKKDLVGYAGTFAKLEGLVGLWVMDKTSTLKGELIKIEGTVKEHRKRLLTLTHREEMIQFIKNAPDAEPVVRILSGRVQYEYVASALGLIIRSDDYSRFGISPREATRSLKIEPGRRLELVRKIHGIASRGGFLNSAYSSGAYPNDFLTAVNVQFTPRLRLGEGKCVDLDDTTLWSSLRGHGIYRKARHFEKDSTIRIGIINGLRSAVPVAFLSRLGDELKRLGFDIQVTRTENLREATRIELERSVDSLQTENPSALLTFLSFEEDQDEEEWGAYHNFKSIAVGRGIPSQVVFQSTINKPYAMANIVLGLLGKTGNIPFVLAEPLPYADLVVGLDIARERKKRLPGSINATAIARIYFGDGEFIRYVIHDTPLEGETVPESVLQGLFPADEFRGKRIVIHRDGYFRGEEKRCLRDWAKRIGAQFCLVEVIKSGSPRLYAALGSAILQPTKGSAFKLSPHEALLVSSPPPFPDATPQPLRIRTDPPFQIERAIHSVLSLTLLHYGSMIPPRLPVTIHYSDRIAYLALRGIKPKDLEGSVPFWL